LTLGFFFLIINFYNGWWVFIREDPDTAKQAEDIELKHNNELKDLQNKVNGSAAPTSVQLAAASADTKATADAVSSGKSIETQIALSEVTSRAATVRETARIAAEAALTADGVSCGGNEEPGVESYHYKGGSCVVKECIGDIHELEMLDVSRKNSVKYLTILNV
jgi:hypothetical protein